MEISLSELRGLILKSSDHEDEFSIKANELIGKFAVVRSNLAGVFNGKVVAIKGSSVILENSFRLWRWAAVAGIGLSGVAKYGVKREGSKIDCIAPIQIISNFDELILGTSEAYEKVSKGGV